MERLVGTPALIRVLRAHVHVCVFRYKLVHTCTYHQPDRQPRGQRRAGHAEQGADEVDPVARPVASIECVWAGEGHARSESMTQSQSAPNSPSLLPFEVGKCPLRLLLRLLGGRRRRLRPRPSRLLQLTCACPPLKQRHAISPHEPRAERRGCAGAVVAVVGAAVVGQHDLWSRGSTNQAPRNRSAAAAGGRCTPTHIRMHSYIHPDYPCQHTSDIYIRTCTQRPSHASSSYRGPLAAAATAAAEPRNDRADGVPKPPTTPLLAPTAPTSSSSSTTSSSWRQCCRCRCHRAGRRAGAGATGPRRPFPSAASSVV